MKNKHKLTGYQKNKNQALLGGLLFSLILLAIFIVQAKNGLKRIDFWITSSEIVFAFFSTLSGELINLIYCTEFFLEKKKYTTKKKCLNIIIFCSCCVLVVCSFLIYILHNYLKGSVLINVFMLSILALDMIAYFLLNIRKLFILKTTEQ